MNRSQGYKESRTTPWSGLRDARKGGEGCRERRGANEASFSNQCRNANKIEKNHSMKCRPEPITSLPVIKERHSAAAERMRRHRDRRRQGLRCLTIELRETEIEAL